jgi:hypothetical protein
MFQGSSVYLERASFYRGPLTEENQELGLLEKFHLYLRLLVLANGITKLRGTRGRLDPSLARLLDLVASSRDLHRIFACQYQTNFLYIQLTKDLLELVNLES